MKTKAFTSIPLFLLASISLLLIISCDEEPTAPDLITLNVWGIANTTANSGGVVKHHGGATVTARGVCWSTSPNPTVADHKTVDGAGRGSYSSVISGLDAGTTYYLRAYGTNSIGTAYGDEIQFSTAP